MISLFQVKTSFSSGNCYTMIHEQIRPRRMMFSLDDTFEVLNDLNVYFCCVPPIMSFKLNSF